jgi:hypothetical protein
MYLQSLPHRLPHRLPQIPWAHSQLCRRLQYDLKTNEKQIATVIWTSLPEH